MRAFPLGGKTDAGSAVSSIVGGVVSGGVELEADDDRVVVARAVRVGCEQLGDLIRGLELLVVVEQPRLVRVDAPHLGTGHVFGERGACQRVVEVAEQPVEDVGVRVLALLREEHVGVPVAVSTSIGSSLS